MKLGILIPALNEAKTIADTINKLPKRIDGIDRIRCIVVDDGSKDDTVATAKKAGAEVISHPINRGVGAAYATGINWAFTNKIDILVNIDADGQFDPAEIPGLVGPLLRNEADLVVGNRFQDGKPAQMSSVKYYGNIMMSWLISKIAGVKLRDVSSGFRAASQEALLNMNLQGHFTYTQESILDLASKNLVIINHPISVKYFPGRKSRVASSISKYTLKTLKIIFRSFRDYQPLKFFSFLGAVFFGLGLILDIFLLSHYLRTGAFSPYIFVGFIGIYLNSIGLGLFVLGFIADMFDRIRKNQEKILYQQKKAILKR